MTSARRSSSASGVHLEDQSHFLETRHIHDIGSVALITSLPSCAFSQLSSDLQSLLVDLEEATSIIYASYERLLDLLDDRHERAVLKFRPGAEKREDELIFSESSFFNYQNSFQAEKDYLINDAFPEWRHKALLTGAALQPLTHPYFAHSSLASTTSHRPIADWWTMFQSTVLSWTEHARRIQVPDFEEVIQEIFDKSSTATNPFTDQSTTDCQSQDTNPRPHDEHHVLSKSIVTSSHIPGGTVTTSILSSLAGYIREEGREILPICMLQSDPQSKTRKDSAIALENEVSMASAA